MYAPNTKRIVLAFVPLKVSLTVKFLKETLFLLLRFIKKSKFHKNLENSMIELATK